MIDPKALEAAAKAAWELSDDEIGWEACKSDPNMAASIEWAMKEAETTITSYLAATPPSDPVTQGWKLVPCEPTKEMIEAGLKRNQQNPHPWCPAVYRAMVAAAPIYAHPPAVTREEVIERVARALAADELGMGDPPAVVATIVNHQWRAFERQARVAVDSALSQPHSEK